MALPLIGVLISLILARIPSLNNVTWLPPLIAAILTLAAAWLLRGQVVETTIGSWSPVSMTGAPLLIATYLPASGVIIAWASILAYDTLAPASGTTRSRVHNQRSDQPSQRSVTAALLFATLVVTAFANNFITLLIALGLTDLLTLWQSSRQGNPRSALNTFLLSGVSLALLIIPIAVHVANGNSLYFPLARMPDLAVPLAALAIALRLGYFPFRSLPIFVQDLRLSGSAIAGLLLLVRLPSLGIGPLPGWLFVLAVVGAIVTLLIGSMAEQRQDEIAAIQTGALYITSSTAALNDPGLTAASAIAWLLGCILVNHAVLMPPSNTQRVVRAMQILGVLCLIGLPLTVGFIGRSGLIASWTGRGLGSWLIALGFVLASALLIHCLLRFILPAFSGAAGMTDADDSGYVLAPTTKQAVGLDILRLIVVAAPVMIFGVAPGLIGAGSLGEALARNGLAGWLAWLLSIVLGVALWWFEWRWSPGAAQLREHAIAVLGLQWLYDVLGGAVARIRSALGYVFTFLESDGALLWTIIVVLLMVLISRPGGP